MVMSSYHYVTSSHHFQLLPEWSNLEPIGDRWRLRPHGKTSKHGVPPKALGLIPDKMMECEDLDNNGGTLDHVIPSPSSVTWRPHGVSQPATSAL